MKYKFFKHGKLSKTCRFDSFQNMKILPEQNSLRTEGDVVNYFPNTIKTKYKTV